MATQTEGGPAVRCWFCGSPRGQKGKCKVCKAPLSKPENWTGHVWKEGDPIGLAVRQDAPKQTIVDTKGKEGKKPKESIHTTVWVKKSTRVKIRELRNRLPYSALCKTDDDLILRLIEKVAA